jgi:transposase
MSYRDIAAALEVPIGTVMTWLHRGRARLKKALGRRALRMSRGADEKDELTSLLQALPAPEPSAEFLGGARRRYLEAVEARHRRAVFTGLTAAVVGPVVTASC